MLATPGGWEDNGLTRQGMLQEGCEEGVAMMAGDGHRAGDNRQYGLLQSAMEELLQRTKVVANLLGSVASGALGAVPEPVPAAVNRLLLALQQLVDQLPPLTAELDILVQEVHAKRLTVQALQAELAAFDHQLEVLEASLAPLEGWSRQLTRMSRSLTETLDAPGG